MPGSIRSSCNQCALTTKFWHFPFWPQILTKTYSSLPLHLTPLHIQENLPVLLGSKVYVQGERWAASYILTLFSYDHMSVYYIEGVRNDETFEAVYEFMIITKPKRLLLPLSASFTSPWWWWLVLYFVFSISSPSSPSTLSILFYCMKSQSVYRAYKKAKEEDSQCICG